MLYEAQDRIAYAFEGAVLAAEDLLDLIRERALIAAAALAAVIAVAVRRPQLRRRRRPAGRGLRRPDRRAAAATSAALIDEQGFSLSLPAGWERAKAPDGASFAAASADGLAKTTLWAEKAPGLGFGAFVDQSMANLDEIGTNVRISDEVGGGALASRITELRAEVPLDGGLNAAYHVVLRASGPYRYYLATSIQPGASPQLVADAELLGTTFRPQVLAEQVEVARASSDGFGTQRCECVTHTCADRCHGRPNGGPVADHCG